MLIHLLYFLYFFQGIERIALKSFLNLTFGPNDISFCWIFICSSIGHILLFPCLSVIWDMKMVSSKPQDPRRVAWWLCSREPTLCPLPGSSKYIISLRPFHLQQPPFEPGLLGVLWGLYGWAFGQGSEQGLSSDISNPSGFSSLPPELGWPQEHPQPEKQQTDPLSSVPFGISQKNVLCFLSTGATVHILFVLMWRLYSDCGSHPFCGLLISGVLPYAPLPY